MKKIIVLLLALIFLLPIGNCVYSDDFEISGGDDLWDNWDSAPNNYREDKNVSDADFEKTVKQLEEKKNKKIRKKQVPKGEEFHQSNETEIINENADKDSLPVICIPAEIPVDGGVIPIGHYQIKGIKDDNGNVFIELYQAHFVMAKFPAVETNDDFGAETITFAKWLPEGEDKIKIIFGSMDMNAYTVVEINK